MRLDFATPQVMAILNITPDSFYAASRAADCAAIEERVERMVAEGAAIIDVGGCSSRPGADEVPVGEEWRRVALGVGAVRRVAPQLPVSVDTFRSEVVERVLDRFGEVMVNDISAGALDPRMASVAARAGIPYVAMHLRGTPQTMQRACGYPDGVVQTVLDELLARVAALRAAGVRDEQLLLDPGFGFAKSLKENYDLLAGLHRICAAGYPVLVGLSRKSMIYKSLNSTPEASLAGTTALNWEALRQGAVVLRVHDVREAVDTVRLFTIYQASL